MKAAFFGGSFDPVHIAHLIVAERVYEELGLDKLWMVPAAQSPHKTDQQPAAGHHRIAMLELALQGQDHLIASDLELKRGGISYTLDTLEQLWQLHGDSLERLYLVIGADNLASFAKWHKPEEIIKLAHLAIVGRPSYQPDLPRFIDAKQCARVDIPLCELSSSEIRKRIKAHASFRYRVPDAVHDYILRNDLYRS